MVTRGRKLVENVNGHLGLFWPQVVWVVLRAALLAALHARKLQAVPAQLPQHLWYEINGEQLCC